MLFLLGQFWLLHSLLWLLGPSLLQSAPPPDGDGLVQVRVRVSDPPPHDLEHLPYGPQAE